MNALGKDFAKGYIVTVIAVAIIGMALGRWAQIELSASGASITSLLAAVTFTASRFARRERVRPTPAFSWRAAIMMMLIATVTSIVLSIGVVTFTFVFGDRASVIALLRALPGQFADLQLTFLVAIVLAVVFGVYTLIIRFTFPFFVKLNLKKVGL